MLALYMTLLEDERDIPSFRRLYRTHHDRMMRMALRFFPKDQKAAEDAVHESFLKIIENFPKISEISWEELGPYVVTIVKNVSLNMLKKQKRLVLTDDWAAFEGAEAPSTEDGFGRLVALIRAMPETYRTALEMRFVLEMDYREIAKVLGISESAVANRVSRGRKLLMEKLKKEGYEP